MEQIVFESPLAMSGSGSGYGDGSGYGYGYGDGDGYGDEETNVAYYAAFASTYSRPGAFMALWRSNKDGTPSNGGSLAPVKIGDIHETEGPLNLCHSGTLHATLNPEKWEGDRLWVVALYGEIAIGEHKIGALKREIVAEL